MTEPTWTTTRSQLIDALASIEVRGVQLPGHTKASVVADDMADAILEQLPGGEGPVTVSREDLVTVLAAMDPWVEAILAQLPEVTEDRGDADDGRVTVSREDLRVFFAKLGRGPSLYPSSEAGQAERRLRDVAGGPA
jgi:hypothetical protein